ncbi:hypothetical protein Fcan01_11250 [Folsomia candida]|uniref:Uncharacterized protein n=1 Tax=Folsomia candida TaxID=158441 RepID=A0A226E8I7_FOLCA|nr:hypothetical protein Fcan01_11250 [Folsomia candida]
MTTRSRIPMRCTSEIDLRDGNFAPVVAKHTSEREEWCVQDPDTTTPTVMTVILDRKTLTLNKLAWEIFSKANVTLTKNIDCSMVKHVQMKFDAANRLSDPAVTAIHTAVKGYQFLTCYAEPYISLGFYLNPFQPELWAVLGTTIVSITALATFVHSFIGTLKHEHFSALMYVLASLFEEEGFMPSRIEKHNFFRISLGIWSLISVVLTNGYNGIMISELNSPRSLSHPETFDRLDCNTKFGLVLKSVDFNDKLLMQLGESTLKEIEHDIRMWNDKFNSFFSQIVDLSRWVPFNSGTYRIDINNTHVDNDCYRLLSTFQPTYEIPTFLVVLFNLALDYTDLSSNHSHSMFRYLSLFSSKHAFYPKGFSYLNDNLSYSVVQRQIEREVVQCGKTVFVGRTSEVKLEYEFLSKKYPDVQFFMSTEAVQSYPTGILIQHGWKSRVVQSLKGVTESGIWTHTKEQELRLKNLNRPAVVIMENSKDFKPTNIATLRGSWPTVFILVGSLISVTILVFITEFRRSIGLSIAKMYCLIPFRHSRKRMVAEAVLVIPVAVCDISKTN